MLVINESFTLAPERIIEKAYLLCRNIVGEELNSKICLDDDFQLKNRIYKIWEDRHFGCFEEASATIIVTGISRTCTHQLVRHRLFSYKQLSMRDTDASKLKFIVPRTIASDSSAYVQYRALTLEALRIYKKLLDLGIPKEDARFCIPMGVETQIAITGNFRTWLHFLGLRTSKKAQWEIRELAWICHHTLSRIAPNVFNIKNEKIWKYV